LEQGKQDKRNEITKKKLQNLTQMRRHDSNKNFQLTTDISKFNICYSTTDIAKHSLSTLPISRQIGSLRYKTNS
jgi:hypothetical protein